MPAASAGERGSERVLGNRYRLVHHLATGGMAEVWEGYDSLLARAVAVKLPLAHLARQRNFLERFRREAVAAARLSHPNVVAVYDTGTDGDDSYIVMELVRGTSLRRLLASDRPVVVERAVSISAQVAGALDFAHRAGVIHRDIKPGNILLGADGLVKVTDFGIAKAAMGDDLTATDTMLGTVRYLSPEMVESRPPDGRSDIYSLGIVLYELLCGRTPFDGETEVAVALKHVREQPPRPSSQSLVEVPAWLDEVVMRCLEKDPAMRFATAGQLRQALLEGLNSTSSIRPRPAGAAVGGVAAGASGTPPGRTEVSGTGEPHEDLPGVVISGSGAVPAGEPPSVGATPAWGDRAVDPPGPRDPTRSLTRRDRPVESRRPGVEAGSTDGAQGEPRRLLVDHDRDAWPPGWEEVDARWSVAATGPLEAEIPQHPRPPARRHRMVPLVAGLVVLAAIGTAAALLINSARHPTAAPTPPPSTAGVPISIASARAFDPFGDGVEDNADLPKLIDGNPGSFWSTDIYASQQFGNLKPGVGFVLVLSSSQSIGRLSVISPTPGWDASVYVSQRPESTLAAWGRPVASVRNAGATVSANLHGVTGGAVLVWLTHLGPSDRVEVGEASLTT